MFMASSSSAGVAGQAFGFEICVDDAPGAGFGGEDGVVGQVEKLAITELAFEHGLGALFDLLLQDLVPARHPGLGVLEQRGFLPDSSPSRSTSSRSRRCWAARMTAWRTSSGVAGQIRKSATPASTQPTAWPGSSVAISTAGGGFWARACRTSSGQASLGFPVRANRTSAPGI